MINLLIYLVVKVIRTVIFLGLLWYCSFFASLMLVADYHKYPGKPRRITNDHPLPPNSPFLTIVGATVKDTFWNLNQARKDFFIGLSTKHDVNNIASFGGVRARHYADQLLAGFNNDKQSK